MASPDPAATARRAEPSAFPSGSVSVARSAGSLGEHPGHSRGNRSAGRRSCGRGRTQGVRSTLFGRCAARAWAVGSQVWRSSRRYAPREGDDDAARENSPRSGAGRGGGCGCRRAGCRAGGGGRIGRGRITPRGPGPVLRHLSQRPAADGRARPRRNRRRRGRPEPRRGRLGAGDREAADRRDAAAGPAASRCRDLWRGGGPARSGHRPEGRGEPRSGPYQHRPPAEPHGVPPRHPRSLRPRPRRDPAAAG